MSSPHRPTPLQWPRKGAISTGEIPLLSVPQSNENSIETDAGYTPPSTSRFTSFFDLGRLPIRGHQRTSGRGVSHRLSSYDGVQLQNPDRFLNLNWCLFILTILCCGFTSYYAFNATLTRPQFDIISSVPTRTIGVLNALSTVSAFLLGELIQTVFERMRWVLASRPTGVSLTEFLGMSRATSMAGVLALICWVKPEGTSGISAVLSYNRKLWIIQRYLSLQCFINR